MNSTRAPYTDGSSMAGEGSAVSMEAAADADAITKGWVCRAGWPKRSRELHRMPADAVG